MTRFPSVGDTFGPYRIVSILGRGGMGVVFEAVQARLHRSVALKVLDPRLADDELFAARFAREAEVLARMDSPHIVTIYDHGEVDGCLYLAMQHVTGGDLGHRIATGPLPLAEALELTRQVVSALADAHARGVIHRDVKPSNVLVATSGDAPFAYLCDFGIAQTATGGLTTTTGTVAGSLAFMAPERHEGRPASPASDLYSAGCLLWATLTGRNPYRGTDVQMAMEHVSAPVPQLPGAGPLPTMLNRLFARVLAKDPADRYQTAGQLLADLDAVLAFVRARPELASVPVALADLTGPGAEGPIGDTLLRIEPTSARPATRGRVPPALLWGGGALAAVVVLLATWLALDLGALREPSQSPVAAGAVRCWDGTPVTALDQCAAPVGEKGLTYVFPSLAQHLASCQQVNYRKTTLSYDCPAGTGGTLRYRYWQDPDEAAAHYAEAYPGKSVALVLDGQVVGTLYRRDTPYQGVYRISGLFLEGHFSFSVESADLPERDRLFATALSIRSADQLRGYPAATGLKVAAIG